ncbi:hypothetical protein ACE4Z6_28080, partial [Salmonella enterica]|uniref:hypothetical protein n=1 Tax=Salmonella enterica TaxID=28901 RepID=UPI003D29A774
IPASIGKGLFPTEDSTHHWAALIGLISILVILAWNFAPKKVRAVPGTLIAVLIAVAIASYVNLPIHYVALPANLTSG